MDFLEPMGTVFSIKYVTLKTYTVFYGSDIAKEY